ncbi:MAG: hypothetical protein Ct9H300mP32_0510 [Verrucomicrobiota bacterium]|nr:MAG: hypothetical protein Ct9H300mP32_0510 [Verrucomicrobiota bacterium]
MCRRLLELHAQCLRGGRRLAGLYKGEFRLLYVAPERLMLPEMLERLVEWQPGYRDRRGHCISEWGHDFRLSTGRSPSYASAFLRAVDGADRTATERVRADMCSVESARAQALLASFNRANLTYRVIPRNQPLRQVLDVARGTTARADCLLW